MEVRTELQDLPRNASTPQEISTSSSDNSIERTASSSEQRSPADPSPDASVERISAGSSPNPGPDAPIEHIAAVSPPDTFRRESGNTQIDSNESSEIDKSNHSPPREAYPWTPGFWKRLPWSAANAIILAILCAAASVVVLIVSDQQEVESWSLRPSVWLAILSALANTCLRFALAEGLCIAWWRRASMPGTIGDLHRYWMCGTSLLTACRSIPRLNVVAVASIIVSAVVIDGPLLQRASSTNLAQISSTTSLNMTVATQLPFGYTGMDFAADLGTKSNRAILTPWFLQTFLAYNQRSPMLATTAFGCTGTCVGEIEAAGLRRECTERSESLSWPADFASDSNISSKRLFGVDWEFMTPYPPMNFLNYGSTPVAEGKDDIIAADEPYIRLNMTYSPLPTIDDDGAITHTLYHKTCNLYSATSRYSIQIQNDTDTTTASNPRSPYGVITLEGRATPIEGSVQNLRRSIAQTGLNMTIQREGGDADPTASSTLNLSLAVSLPVTYFADRRCAGTFNCQLYTTLAGLRSAAQDALAANVTGTPSGSNGVVLSISGPLTHQLRLSTKTIGVDGLDPFDASTGWADPSDLIFSTLDEIMFRTALDTAHLDALANVTWHYEDASRSLVVEAPTRNATGQYTAYPPRQVVTMQQTRTVQVFTSNYAFLAGGLATIFTTIVAILPVFHGFWLLGRETSLSPLETASAFGAPILLARGSNSNMPAREIVKAVGDVPARYGVLELELGTGDNAGLRHRRRLQFGEPSDFGVPRVGSVYD